MAEETTTHNSKDSRLVSVDWSIGGKNITNLALII